MIVKTNLLRLMAVCFSIGSLFFVGCVADPSTALNKNSNSGFQLDSVRRLEVGRVGFVISDKKGYDEKLMAVFEKGVEALESNDYDKAIGSFRLITRKAPGQSSPWVNLAIAYIRSGRAEQAEKALQKALGLVPGHPLASHEYGLLLRRSGRFAEARAVYEASLQYFPEYYPINRNFGVLCDIYLNDPDCAARQYALFLEAQPTDEQVNLWLAEVQGRLGR